MRYQEGDFKAIHRWPIWRERSNFIFTAFLGSENGKNEWEQLWGRQVAPRRFIVCCIPSFAYDIALGDEVETDENFLFQRVIRPSGQITFRVFLLSRDHSLRENISRDISAIGPLTEWYSENLVGFSVPDEESAQRLADCLHIYQTQGLLAYETGRTSR